MKNTLLILLLSVVTNLVAQNDTLYFNAAWNKSSKKEANFFRPLPLKKVGDLYKVKDYYMNGNLQMEGYWSDIKNETLEGKASWYYENGNQEQEYTYHSGEKNGLTKTFFEDGTLKTEGIYKSDKAFNGTFEDCCPYKTVEKRNGGKRIESYRYYMDSKVIAEKSILNKEGHTIEILVYNKKGEQLAAVTVKPYNQYVDGKNVWFQNDMDRNILYIAGFATYEDGVLEGEAVDFDSKGKAISKGIYKNGKPYSGTFYNDNKIKTYANGILEGKEIAYNERQQVIAKGINKNNQHWEGKFKNGNHQIGSFENGKLEGKQTMYYTDSFDHYFKRINTYYHIVNNKKEGESAYYNKEGKQLAKGIYKNDKPYSGTFYDDESDALSSYKEGKKQGLFIQYDRKGKIIAQQEYTEGKISGATKSTGYFKDRTCTCTYKEGEPFSGEVCEDLSVFFYKNGKIIKREAYKREAQENLEEIQFYNENGEVVKRITYKNDKLYTLTFKNGKPYNGQFYSEYSNGQLTYKDGRLNGPFTEYTYEGIFISGNYKDEAWNGILTFEDKLQNKTTTCTYKDGKPIDGTAIDGNCMTTYKNGLKTEVEQCKRKLYFRINNEYTAVYDSIAQNYKKGKLDGKVRYFNAGKLVSSALYHDGHINQGTIYVNRTFENYYQNNKLVTSTYYFGKYKLVEEYKTYLITKETTYKDSKTIYQGNFKNGEAYDGAFITIEDKEEPREYKITYYKKGKKQGKEQVVNLIDNTIEETTIYKKGIRIKTTKKFRLKDADSIIGIYKKGNPFSGYFYTTDNSIEKIEHYKKGIKTGMQYYYSATGSLLKSPLDSIEYAKGKPYNGVDIEVVDKDYHKHFYKNGKRTQIEVYDIYYKGKTDPPLFEIRLTDTGFITVKSTGDSFEKCNELTYTTADKTEGKVTFFAENEKGYLQFKNGKLVDVQIKSNLPYTNFTMYLEKPNVLLADAKSGDFRVKMYPEYKLSAIPDYNDFLAINQLFFKGNGIAYFYLEDNFLSKCTIKNGQGYEGIVIKQQKSGLFIHRRYQEGKSVKTRKKLTKKELIKLLKE